MAVTFELNSLPNTSIPKGAGNTVDTRHEKTDFSEFDPADIIAYILEKSVSCQKKDGRGHTHPSFFWYDNDKDLKVCFLVTSVSKLTQ